MRHSSTVIVVSIVVCISAVAWPGTIIQPKFWNEYRGLLYSCAAEKKNFNQCEVDMRIDSDGVTFSRYIGDYYFRIHYPPNWISENKRASAIRTELAEGGRIYSLRDTKRKRISETQLI